jgi:signal peptidase I
MNEGQGQREEQEAEPFSQPPEDRGQEQPGGAHPTRKRKSGRQIFREYAEAIVTAIVLALLIRAFVVQAFKIPSGSMLQTLQIGDHLLVNKFVYGFDVPFKDRKVLGLRDPRQGDIIVFKYPEDPRRDFIKRVIGIGGDIVEIKEKQVYVNGRQINEPYVNKNMDDVDFFLVPYCDEAEDRKWPNRRECNRDNLRPKRVPEGTVFVMGDNRDNSQDSRFWGFVNLEDIRGKAFIIYWSQDGSIIHPRWDRFGMLIR